MDKPKNILAVCLTPLLYINMAALAAGAVWLGVLMQWHVIWLGLMLLLFSSYIIPLLMVPAGILSHFMLLCRGAGRHGKEKMMYVLSISYIILFMTLFCVGVFEYVTKSVIPAALWAALLWTNGSAFTSLLLWIAKDRGNVFMTTVVLAAQTAQLSVYAFRVFSGIQPFWFSAAVFAGVTALITVGRIVYEEKKLPR